MSFLSKVTSKYKIVSDIQSEIKTPLDRVCYEIASNDELFNHISFYVSGDPEGLNDHPEVTKKLEDTLKKMKPFKPTASDGRPMDLYRGESEARNYENYREVESWTPNKETALNFAKNASHAPAVRKTMGAVQGLSLESLVYWRMRIHPNESHYSGGQAEWLLIRPKNVKTVYTKDGGWSYGEIKAEFRAHHTVGNTSEIRLYRGLEQKFDSEYDISKSDAPHGYSTWTDSLELAKQYAGENGYIYYLDLPKSDLGKSAIDENPKSETYGDRVLFFFNGKPASLNGVTGKEALVYTLHDLYDPKMVKEVK